MGEQRRGWLDRLLGRQQSKPSQGGQARGLSQHEPQSDSPPAFGQRKPPPSSPIAGGNFR